MADLNYGGAASGAIAGAGIGSAIPVIGTGVGAAVGGLAGLFSKRRKPSKPQQIDITKELAMIGELYNQARTQQQELGARQLAQGLTQTSESLAGRGIYRSPVSQRAIGDTRKTYAMALSDALARLSAEEMAKRIELSSAAKQYNANQVAEYNRMKDAISAQNRAALTSGITSLGAGLLMRNYMPTTPSATQNISAGVPMSESPFAGQQSIAQMLAGNNPNLRLLGGGY